VVTLSGSWIGLVVLRSGWEALKTVKFARLASTMTKT